MRKSKSNIEHLFILQKIKLHSYDSVAAVCSLNNKKNISFRGIYLSVDRPDGQAALRLESKIANYKEFEFPYHCVSDETMK